MIHLIGLVDKSFWTYEVSASAVGMTTTLANDTLNTLLTRRLPAVDQTLNLPQYTGPESPSLRGDEFGAAEFSRSLPTE
jgi:hypothetical protein